MKFDEKYNALISEFGAARDLLEMLKRLPVAITCLGDISLGYNSGAWWVYRGEEATQYPSLKDAMIAFAKEVSA